MPFPSAMRDFSGGHATTRPLVLSSVLLAMTVLLIYLLISFPRPFVTVRKTPLKTTVVPVYSVPQPDNSPYSNLNDSYHRFQVPMFNVPYLYILRMRVFLPWKESVDFGASNFTLEGFSKMLFTVAKTNNRIQVHFDGQHIASLHIEDDFGRAISVAEISRVYPHLLDIWTEHELIEHMNYSLHIKYTAEIKRDNTFVGIYASKYKENGENRWLVATHCQTQHARAIFPCLDHPEAKARIETTIEHPVGTSAVFNGKERTQITKGNWTITKFARSPLMSTYLFAMTVSDFAYSEVYANKVRIRVYVPPSKLNDTALAIWSLPRLMNFFEKYFKIPCPLTKLDVFGVPQMKMMGMENWGLITVLLRDLIYHEKTQDPGQRRETLELLSHELAHQWFGNLVTMKWWNNLWLNEGFATMMGQKAVEDLDGVSSHIRQIASDLRYHQDPRKSVPISRKDVSFNPDAQFKGVYVKPRSIMKMVERIVGPASFRAGITRFLQRFAYSNADHTDLMEALTYAHDSSSGSHLSGQPFSLNDFISTWIYQAGFPVIDVKCREDGVQIVTQSAYRHISGRPLPFDSLQWKIPLFYRHPVTHEPVVDWLLENGTVALDIGDDLVLNREGTSFLRIRYDNMMYEKIIERLHTQMSTIPTLTRGRLVEDAFTFAEQESISYVIPFNLTAHVIYEEYDTFFGVVAMYNAHLDFLYSRLRIHPQFHIIQKYTVTIFENWFERCHTNLHAKAPTHNQCSACELVYRRVCMAGSNRCLEIANEMVDKLQEDCKDARLSSECNKISPCIRSALYAASVMYGNKRNFEFLYKKHEEEKYSQERQKIWQGMAASNRKEHIHRIWHDALFANRANVKLMDHAIEYCRYYFYPNHFISFVSENVEKIIDELPKGDKMAVLQVLARTIFTPDDLKEYLRIEDLMHPSFPLPKMQNLSQRYHVVEDWKKHMGHYVIGNVTQVLIYLGVSIDD